MVRLHVLINPLLSFLKSCVHKLAVFVPLPVPNVLHFLGPGAHDANVLFDLRNGFLRTESGHLLLQPDRLNVRQ